MGIEIVFDMSMKYAVVRKGVLLLGCCSRHARAYLPIFAQSPDQISLKTEFVSDDRHSQQDVHVTLAWQMQRMGVLTDERITSPTCI